MWPTLTRGQLPPRDAVRVEEMVNYFPYDYPAPGAVGEDLGARLLAHVDQTLD